MFKFLQDFLEIIFHTIATTFLRRPQIYRFQMVEAAFSSFIIYSTPGISICRFMSNS